MLQIRIYLAATLSASFIGAAIAGDLPATDPMMPGVVMLKLMPQQKVDLPIRGAPRIGIAGIDRYLDRIDAALVRRSFPHCNPPKPDGTDLTRIYTIHFPESITPVDVSNALVRFGEVEFAHPVYIPHVFLDHNDEFRERQWGMDVTESNRAHDISTGDTDVVIAVVDNGQDVDHPDLVGNRWLNPGEDLNGNGEIDDDERNDQDDDDNGFVDDFWGWDFSDNNNDPDDDGVGPFAGHGTHVAGVASAVTNNETGIASIAFSCKIMMVRTGSGGQLPFAYEGVEYAATNGADIINCSWGSNNLTAAQRAVLDYAVEQGSLVIAAAGNSANSNRHYPAAYDPVVAVAATNVRDQKAGFSSYGEWVDVSAPGDSIFSCFLDGDYRIWEGTSMASPFAASVAALIKSEYPELSSLGVRIFLLAGADNIDEQNPNLVGRLGAGRINAYNSLTIDHPLINMSELNMVRDDNSNDHIERGETIYFTLEISNFGQTADEVRAVMTCEDEDVEIAIGEIEYPALNPGDSHENIDDPFIIQINEDAGAHTTHLTVHITAQPGDIELEEEFEILIGWPAFLIVDDDDGEETEQLFARAIEEMRMGYQRWDVVADDAPTAADLMDHRISIWVTGNATPPLSDYDKHAMQTAIREGANVMLIGKHVGDDAQNQAFLRESFAASHQVGDDSIAATHVTTLPNGRPFGEDIDIMLYDPDNVDENVPDGRWSASGVRPVRYRGDTLLVYRGEADTIVDCAGVFRIDERTQAHTVYLGFALEAATDLRTPRHRLIAHLIDWFFDYQSAPSSENSPTPGVFLLEPAFPNPFNESVRFRYSLPAARKYSLVITDTQGRTVATVFDRRVTSGSYTTSWSAPALPSGVYLARLSSEGLNTIERKLVLIK